MVRLDSLSPKELNKLCGRAATLPRVATLIICIAVLLGILAIFVSPLMLLFAIPAFAISYVFNYVRTSAARIYFYICSISRIIGSILAILFVFITSTDIYTGLGYFVGSIIVLLISIAVLKSARTDGLFGTDYFTHKQILFALNKLKKNESFVDEDLPKSSPKPILSKICVIIAFVFEGLVILGGIGNLFASPATPPQNNEYLNKAYQAVEQENYNEAFGFFQKAAQDNTSDAQVGLALCYLNAWGTPQNMAEAAKHFEVAALKDHPQAQYFLGMIYYYGNGRPQNFSKAAELLEKSANQGHPEAQKMLSYQDGKKQDTHDSSLAEKLSIKYQAEINK